MSHQGRKEGILLSFSGRLFGFLSKGKGEKRPRKKDASFPSGDDDDDDDDGATVNR